MTRPTSPAPPPKQPGKRLRMDAQRNRDAIMAAAREIIAIQGPQVAMETIAATAGVGIGTLYRHFADRDTLIRAISYDRLEHVAHLATESKASFAKDPKATWVSFFDGFVASGLPMLLPSMIQAFRAGNVFDESLVVNRDRTIAALSEIVDLARAEGFVRTDIALPEIVILIAGALRPPPGIPAEVHSLMVARRGPLLRAAIAPSDEALPGDPISPELIFALSAPPS